MNYKSKYGRYDNCWFEVHRYVDNDNLAIEIWSPIDGPVTRVTVNTDVPLSDDYIAVKNYSENEGMVEWLISEGLVESEIVDHIESGWVDIPVVKLTMKGKEALGI